LTGYTREELLRKKITELQDQFSDEDFINKTAQIEQFGENTNEIKLLTKSGELKPVLIFDKIIDFEGKNAILGQIHDITDRVEAQRKTKESEELLRTLINSTPDIVCFKDGQGRWMEANKADLELFQLEDVDYHGKTDMELSDLTLPVYKKAFEACMISDEYVWEKRKATHTDENIPDGKGNLRTYDVIKVPLFYPDGSRKGMVVLGRDITLRKKAEEKLLKSEEKSRSILAALPDMIFEFDSKGMFISVHAPEPGELLMSEEDFIGKNISEVLDSSYVDLTMKKIKLTLNTNSIQVYQYQMPVDGKTKYFESRMVPKGEYHVLAIVRDITEQKQSEATIADNKTRLEKQNRELESINAQLQKTVEALKTAKAKAEESNKLKSAFLATMSHELRTPLNSIIGFSEMLHDQPTPTEAEEYGSNIHSSGTHLLGLVEEIFDLSLIESGQARAVKEYFYLKNLMDSVHQILKSYQKKLQKNHIDLLVDNEKQCVETTIFSDQVKLRQILINLIKNALKFTENGYVKYGCRSKTVSGEPGILFYVEDSGIGIPKYKQARIFDMFYQADNSDTRKYGGSGIGLSVAKKISTLLSGTIDLDSHIGKGTTFRVWIPTQSINNQNKSIDSKINSPLLSDKTILIAEDDPSSAELLRRIISSTNAIIIAVDNGKDAVKRHKEADLIVMDLQMPQMGGMEATKIIKQSSPATPIIAVTARAMKGDKEEAIKAGCDDYLSKPFKKEHLLKMISRNLV
ncbi:MAG TPA: PAS domain S-box protein, partial [Bacteroidales bacterium]|nr:PAS domain S-box protein [Bacteroidales bacterium]